MYLVRIFVMEAVLPIPSERNSGFNPSALQARGLKGLLASFFIEEVRDDCTPFLSLPFAIQLLRTLSITSPYLIAWAAYIDFY